jgi:hypothetical protein
MWCVKFFKYIEPIWLGSNNQLSIRRVLALVFSFNLVCNISASLADPKLSSSHAEVAMLLGIEAGLIAALMSLTTYSTAIEIKKGSTNSETE